MERDLLTEEIYALVVVCIESIHVVYLVVSISHVTCNPKFFARMRFGKPFNLISSRVLILDASLSWLAL